ncbi:hypothetical protein [Saccharothrix sp. HUAS TT1]|uniref:hypothetical protein n=1 Tax=unclassified Saccharothrix TaxID=2593673 RepID=UPI00345B5D35
MGDIAALLDSLANLLTALVSAGATATALWGIRRARRERHNAAEQGVSRALQALVDAAQDGQITPDEITEVSRHLNPDTPDEPPGGTG